jgi:hypothetical protein
MKNTVLFGIIGIVEIPKPHRKGVSCMINQNAPSDQLPKEIKPAFQELKVLKHLNAAGFKKKFGFTCAYLFRIVFVLLFHQKNWFRLLESSKGESFPGKDAVYRFLNHSGYAWRRFLLSLSGETIARIEPLTSSNRETALIFDDSMYVLAQPK